MKKIWIATFLLCGLFANSQVQPGIYTPVHPTTFGDHVNRIKVDSVSHLPEKDSLRLNTTDSTAQIFFNKLDSSIWGYSKYTGFFKVGSSSGGGTTTLPLTTLGDWLNHDGTDPVRIAGNTTTIKKVLTQTGNGTISALPVFEPIIIANWTANPPAVGRTVITDGIGGVTDAASVSTLQDGPVGNSCPVVWDSLLIFTVGVPCIYNINQVQYFLSTAVDVTLIPADPTDPRFDNIITNITPTATYVDGTPDANPEIPVVDPTSQLILTSVLVDAGATTPTQVGVLPVRDEGDPGEWTIIKTVVSTDNYGTNPKHLSISQRVTTAANNTYMMWSGPTQSKAAFNTLVLYIRNNSVLNNARNLTARLFNNATQVGNAINLTTYGYSKTITGTYQLIAIPMSAFAGADAFNRIRITNTGTGGTVDWQVDWVQLQSGIIQSSNLQNTITTITADDASTYTASSPNSAIIISGQSGITTSISGNTIFIDGSATANIYTADGTSGANRTYNGGGNFLHFNNISNFYVSSADNGYFQLSDASAIVVGDTLVSIFTLVGSNGKINILGHLFGDAYSVTDSLVAIDAVSGNWKSVSVSNVLAAAAGSGLTVLENVATAPASANYTITTKTYIILSDLTGQANRTLTLPAGVSGKHLYIHNKDASAFNWTFSGTVKDWGGNTVSTIVDLTVYQLVYDGTNWQIIN